MFSSVLRLEKGLGAQGRVVASKANCEGPRTGFRFSRHKNDEKKERLLVLIDYPEQTEEERKKRFTPHNQDGAPRGKCNLAMVESQWGFPQLDDKKGLTYRFELGQ